MRFVLVFASVVVVHTSSNLDVQIEDQGMSVEEVSSIAFYFEMQKMLLYV
jgi:hypothetical protein